MYKASTRAELEVALKNKENKVIVTDKKIVKTLQPLHNVVIGTSNRNRCKYTLEKSYDGSAFLGSFGFAPLVSEIGNVSFFSAMGIISSVGLHQILIIFDEYNIKFENNEILLNRI